MPNCPGCYESVPYDRLAAHQRYCTELRDSDLVGARSVERLDRRVELLEERLEARLRTIEEQLSDSTFGGRMRSK
ncbi:hypothetical protein [Haloarchaeobius sp. HRN-SO-5]|uniref:hypothetical protein n=1 Tax=Haloarchaeobius sp. HRN-SO-5 TaxID=3446118 RepID=UPI003EC100AD